MENSVDTGRGLSVGRTWERCGGSTVGEVRKDVAEGRTSVESLEGHSYHELRLEDILYPIVIKSLIKPLINIESKSDRQSGIKVHQYETLIIESQTSGTLDPGTQNVWDL